MANNKINRRIKLPLAILAAMVFASSAHAQAHSAFSSPSAGRAGMASSGRHGGIPIARVRRSHHSSTGSGYVPYFYDDEAKCYGVHRDFFMPPVQLTLDESLALAALAEHVGGG